MKQGISIHLPVKFDGLDLTETDEIVFIFKRACIKTAEGMKTSYWKSDGTGDCITKPNTTDTVLVPWSESDTYLFAENRDFYMDTKVTLTGSTDNPETNIVKLTMNPTLFEEGS